MLITSEWEGCVAKQLEYVVILPECMMLITSKLVADQVTLHGHGPE